MKPTTEPTWGVPADQAIAELESAKVLKWDKATATWRLEDHCRALAWEGNSREDTLKYLTDLNREATEKPEELESHRNGYISVIENIVFANMQYLILFVVLTAIPVQIVRSELAY